MADVSPPPVPGSDASRGGPRDSERGQLFLVGALALSVILVTLAVLLNTAIYTGNIATRDPGTGSADVIEYRTAANEMASSTLSGVNSNDYDDYSTLETDYKESIGAWSVASTRHSAVKGVDAHSETKTMTRGTRIVQDSNRVFTSANDELDWDLADYVRIRDFTLTLDEATVSSSPDENFRIQFHDPDSSIYWEISVYESDSQVWIQVSKFDGSETSLGECSTTESPTIDFTQATFGGDDCGALAFWGETDGKYRVRYEEGDKTAGTYSLVVKEDFTTLESEYHTDETTPPYVTHALYSAEVEVVYRSPTVDYSTQFRVAPGEYDG